MEWAIVIIIVVVVGRYGISGLTGGLALTAAGLALVVGVNSGALFVASLGGLFLLAALAGGYVEAKEYLSDHLSDQVPSRRA